MISLATACGEATAVAPPTGTVALESLAAGTPVPSMATAITAEPSQVRSPTMPAQSLTPEPMTPPPAAVTPRPPTPTTTVIPPPQTRAGPTPTWTATPNPSIPVWLNGCASNRAFAATDCVARRLPPGAAVSLNVNEVGGTTYVVNWLPPVDANGNVPFAYRRPSPGNTVFTATAGGAVVRFEFVFY